MTIIADSAIPFLQGVLEPWAKMHYIPGSQITPEHVRDADALIVRTRTRCDKRLLEGSSVRLVATATIGFDHIDTAWCSAHGIRTATAAGCNARGVLQWVSAVLAHLSAAQGWQPAERTLGVVGVGHVGSLVAEYAAWWGFHVLCCDPPRRQREGGDFLYLEEVAAQADILTFHTPLDATTRHMASYALFGMLKPGAVIINSSRGEVADTQALSESGHPYVLDVWEGEPHPAPAILANALLSTPHIAGYSEQGKATATAMAVEAVCSEFGFPLRGWYPPQAAPSAPHPISWQELCTSIPGIYDIAAESLRLKTHPEAFESMRDHYAYRREYF